MLSDKQRIVKVSFRATWIFALIVVVVSFTLLISSQPRILGVSFNPANAELGAAVSASIAIVIATLAFLVTVVMQSPEYLTEIEVINGLRKLQAVLFLMAQETALNKEYEPSESEKNALLDVYYGAAGRFIITHSGDKSKIAGDNHSEVWRAVHIDFAYIMMNKRPHPERIVGLLQMISILTESDIVNTSRKLTRASSLPNAAEYLTNDIVIRAIVGNREKRSRSADSSELPMRAMESSTERYKLATEAAKKISHGLAEELADALKVAQKTGKDEDWIHYTSIANKLIGKS